MDHDAALQACSWGMFQVMPMGDPEREPGFVAGCLIWVIRVVALLIALTVWGVIGFLYWIPMLVFAVVRFSALVVYMSLARMAFIDRGANRDDAFALAVC